MATLIRHDGRTETLVPKSGAVFDLKELQAAVEGYIERIKLADGRIMFVNEDGKYLEEIKSRRNAEATRLLVEAGGWSDDFVVGNVLITTPEEVGEENDDTPRLGPCCSCEKTGPDVRNVIMLDKRAAIAGHGWGCFQCGLPMDGASYVQCDGCLEAKREPIYACRGYPEDGRIDIKVLTVPFEHDMSKHEGER